MQAVFADTTVTCYTDCNPVYSSWEGVVTLNLQCNEDSPQSYTAQLMINGVSTPVNTKICPIVDITVTSCYIGLDESNCLGKVVWEFHDAVSPYVVKNVVLGFPDDVFGTTLSGSGDIILQYGENEIEAYGDGRLIGLVAQTISCDLELEWSNTKQRCLGPEVDITVSGCVIPLGESNCTGQVRWYFFNADAPYRVTNETTNIVIGITDSGNSSIVLDEGINTITASADGVMLGTKNITVKCEMGTAWYVGFCVDDHSPVLTLNVKQSVLPMNGSTTISWTISDFTMNTCTLRGPGVPGVAITTSPGTLPIGPFTTSAIFELVCTSELHPDIKAQTTVDVVPKVYET